MDAYHMADIWMTTWFIYGGNVTIVILIYHMAYRWIPEELNGWMNTTMVTYGITIWFKCGGNMAIPILIHHMGCMEPTYGHNGWMLTTWVTYGITIWFTYGENVSIPYLYTIWHTYGTHMGTMAGRLPYGPHMTLLLG